MIRALIVDDEKSARELLTTLLQKIGGVEIIGEANSIQKASEMILEYDPEFVFLDIEMPNGSGFELLDIPEIQNQKFKVIFTTAFEQYAIKAIKYAALDYLLKPIDLNELKSLINNIQTKSNINVISKNWIDDLKVAFNKSNRLKLVSRDGFEMVNIDTIIYLKADTNYTTFYFDSNPPKLISKTMKIYQLYLESHGFLRIHRSHIVNGKKIQKYLTGKGGQVEMENGVVLDVGNDFKKGLLEFLENK